MRCVCWQPACSVVSTVCCECCECRQPACKLYMTCCLLMTCSVRLPAFVQSLMRAHSSKLPCTCTAALSFAAGKDAIPAEHAVVCDSIPRTGTFETQHLQLCHDSPVGCSLYVVYTCWPCNCVQAHQQSTILCTAWQQAYHVQKADLSMWKRQRYNSLLRCFGLKQKLYTSCMCRFMWGKGLLQKPQLQPCQLASTAKLPLMAHRYSMSDCSIWTVESFVGPACTHIMSILL